MSDRYYVFYMDIRSHPMDKSALQHLLFQGEITPSTSVARADGDPMWGDMSVQDILSTYSSEDYQDILNQGVAAWSRWRTNSTSEFRFFCGQHLNDALLDGIDFSRFDLSYSWMLDAQLRGANFSGASLRHANLAGADLSNATIVDTDLCHANLTGANLSGAKLINCQVYGVSAWDVNLSNCEQHALNISENEDPGITIDNLKLAQFISLILKNEEVRNIIETIASKVVLILGRFTAERKLVLDSLRLELRARNYTPIIFDFEKPLNRDTVETMSTLAHLSKFVVADLTNAKSVLQELQAIVPSLPSVPVQPIVLFGEELPAMFDHTLQFRNVLKPFRYRSLAHLMSKLDQNVIAPAERKCRSSLSRQHRRHLPLEPLAQTERQR